MPFESKMSSNCHPREMLAVCVPKEEKQSQQTIYIESKDDGEI
jgi:hypothetical protein